MKLQNRNLSTGLQGDDVKLLQAELKQLKFQISDADGVFGDTTLKAVSEFQRTHGLVANGLVDGDTAKLINAEVDRARPTTGAVFLVVGTVTGPGGVTAPGIPVRAFEITAGQEDLLGGILSDAQGHYQIFYVTRHPFPAPPGATGADIVARAYNPQGAVIGTSSVIHNAQLAATADLTVTSAPPPLAPFHVNGTVQSADLRPLAGITVQAFHQALHESKLLGKTVSDSAGKYDIGYDGTQFPSLAAPDLVVRAFDGSGKQVAASHIVFHAPATLALDLTLAPTSPPPSLLQALSAKVTPALEGIPLADLTSDDIALLASKTGAEPQNLTGLRDSALLARDTKLPVAIFYAFASQNLPGELPKLLALPPDRHRQALQAARSRCRRSGPSTKPSTDCSKCSFARRWIPLAPAATPSPSCWEPCSKQVTSSKNWSSAMCNAREHRRNSGKRCGPIRSSRTRWTIFNSHCRPGPLRRIMARWCKSSRR
jgi:peptidoglycan hydrolase-like protein with peptidoglycan-binding domain